MKFPSSSKYSDNKMNCTLLPPLSHIIHDETKSNQSNQTRSKQKHNQKQKEKIPTKRIGRPKGRRTTSHSHLIRPKRPRSAYNFFFRDERNKIARAACLDGNLDASSTEESTSSSHFQILVTNDCQENGKRKRGRPRGSHYRPRRKVDRHGLVDFRALAKTAGTKWKSLSEEAKKPYKDLAKIDLDKYRAAMKQYNAEVEIYEHLNTPDESMSSDSAKHEVGKSGYRDILEGHARSLSVGNPVFGAHFSDSSTQGVSGDVHRQEISWVSPRLSDFETHEQNANPGSTDKEIRKIFAIDSAMTIPALSSTTSLLSSLLREAFDHTTYMESQQEQNTLPTSNVIPTSSVASDLVSLLDGISTRVKAIQSNSEQPCALGNDPILPRNTKGNTYQVHPMVATKINSLNSDPFGESNLPDASSLIKFAESAFLA